MTHDSRARTSAVSGDGLARPSRGLWSRLVLLTTLALAAMVALAACYGESTPPDVGATFEEVVEDDDDRLVGETVTISARIDEVVAPATFFLGRNADERLLVVGAEEVQPGGSVFVGGSYVQVTGEVRDFVTAEVRSEVTGLSAADLSAAQEENYVRAESVQLLSEADAERLRRSATEAPEAPRGD